MRKDIILGLVIVCIFIVGAITYFYEGSRLRNIIRVAMNNNIAIIDNKLDIEKDKYLNELSVLRYSLAILEKDRGKYQFKYKDLKMRGTVRVYKEVPKNLNEYHNAFIELGYINKIMYCYSGVR